MVGDQLAAGRVDAMAGLALEAIPDQDLDAQAGPGGEAVPLAPGLKRAGVAVLVGHAAQPGGEASDRGLQLLQASHRLTSKEAGALQWARARRPVIRGEEDARVGFGAAMPQE